MFCNKLTRQWDMRVTRSCYTQNELSFSTTLRAISAGRVGQLEVHSSIPPPGFHLMRCAVRYNVHRQVGESANVLFVVYPRCSGTGTKPVGSRIFQRPRLLRKCISMTWAMGSFRALNDDATKCKPASLQWPVGHGHDTEL
jgi:hypothetical protein